MPKVVIGTYRVVNGELIDETRPVEFRGELLARCRWETSPFAGVRQRLFKIPGGRYVVSVATWRTKPRQETVYSLVEVDEADLAAGGEFEALGQALRSEALDLETALTLQQALEIIGGE